LIQERLSQLGLKEEPNETRTGSTSLERAVAEGLKDLCGAASRVDSEIRYPQSAVALRFLTPARIRVTGDLQTELSFELLVRNLLRRVSMLAVVHGEGPMDLDYRGLIDRAKSVATRRSNFRWWDLQRYTDRQHVDRQYPDRQGGKLKVGGMIGEVGYEGEAISEFLPLLIAGELLSVGTGTSLGLGRYCILQRGV
jgi:hypothetical protein